MEHVKSQYTSCDKLWALARPQGFDKLAKEN
ncbi:hypothetical protein HOR75_gp46 [Shewanella phage SppYZU05]|uniref:Uncharacterized protein n=1 Tax=Shewanella phage SppYZU05 TaxID=1970795 RepID=A0A1W6JTH5_9CAUD|nr:hypothetical protein HOR75_gp46 [Shewanella phage SppYZU05]ARM70572.1 hypothetical protein SppYZU05_46 [Shewanella phage SppYZU05]